MEKSKKPLFFLFVFPLSLCVSVLKGFDALPLLNVINTQTEAAFFDHASGLLAYTPSKRREYK